MIARITLILLAAIMTVPATAAEPVLLYSAGSLRSALNEAAAAFERASGQKVQPKYGASGPRTRSPARRRRLTSSRYSLSRWTGSFAAPALPQ
jgi:hypothetical protein